MKLLSILLVVGLFVSCQLDDPEVPAFAGEENYDIVFNQLGFYPAAAIRFSVITESATRDTLGKEVRRETIGPDYFVMSAAGDSLIRRGTLPAGRDWHRVGGVRASMVETDPLPVGSYRIYVPGLGRLHGPAGGLQPAAEPGGDFRANADAPHRKTRERSR